MGDMQQPPSAGTSATGAEAAAALAEIQRRQEHVIKTALVPVWYWWVIAAATVAIGAARDNGHVVVQAITIPLAGLVIAALIVWTIPAVRRVQMRLAAQPRSRAVAAMFSMILLVDAVILATSASLAGAHARYPGTIGCAAGAAVLVIAGPLLNRYWRRLLLRQVRQQTDGAADAGGSTT
jgi:hypothetical protein